MLIVIDYRGLAKTVTYSLVSGAVACIFPTEPEEVGHRLMKIQSLSLMTLNGLTGTGATCSWRNGTRIGV